MYNLERRVSQTENMLKIRLRRVGAKHHAEYRIVVADARSPRDGAFVEVIGHYNPQVDPPEVHLDEEKARKWLGQGAQPTDPVARIVAKLGILERAQEK